MLFCPKCGADRRSVAPINRCPHCGGPGVDALGELAATSLWQPTPAVPRARKFVLDPFCEIGLGSRLRVSAHSWCRYVARLLLLRTSGRETRDAGGGTSRGGGSAADGGGVLPRARLEVGAMRYWIRQAPHPIAARSLGRAQVRPPQG